MNDCYGLQPIITLIKALLNILQIVVPILLIVWGSLDLGKAVMANDDKEIKGATGKLIKRAVAAAIVFFIPWLVTLIMTIVADNSNGAAGGATNFAECWTTGQSTEE
mgnify:CR=1 FL=1